MINKHGLYNAEIHFSPSCGQKIVKGDTIEADNLKVKLYCVEKDRFVIVSIAPMESFLTDDDLTLDFKIV